MKFELNHDWQGNMSSPRSTLGEKTKIHLFLMLAVIWIFTGLVGSSPWIPAESENISMVMDIVLNNSIILSKFFHPSLLHMTRFDYPILYG